MEDTRNLAENQKKLRDASKHTHKLDVEKNVPTGRKLSSKFQRKPIWWKKITKLWETSDMAENNTDANTRVIFRELVLYILFLTTVLISAFGISNETRYYYTKAMEDLFINSYSSADKPFTEITTLSEFWSFAETVMIDGFFWDYWYRTKDKRKQTSQDDKKILYENKLLGCPRIRQVRVRPNSCIIQEHFRRSFTTCYAPYSTDAEDDTPFGPAIGTAWDYSSDSKVGALTYSGKVATYNGGGYYEDLPISSRDDMELVISILKDNIWIQRGTRAVFIDFTVYNANVNLFCIVKLVVELPPTGGIVPSWDFNTVKLLRYVSVFDFFVLGCELMVVAYILFYIMEEVNEIIFYKRKYFEKGWNLFDLLIIMITLVCICISIYRTVKVRQKIDRLIDNTHEYPNFENLGSWETQYNNMAALVVFLVWIKIFKFIKYNRTMSQLAQTLRRCSKDVLGFSLMFSIVFLAYAQLGHLIFGDQLENFYNLARSSFTLLRAILGDFDYESIADVDRIAGPIFYLSYIFIVFFILLNVFLAIITDTYSEVKGETEPETLFHVGNFCCRGLRNLLIKLRIMKKKRSREDKEKKLTGHKIRELLTKHNFTDSEVDVFLAKYGIDNEELAIDEETAKRMLKDMQGKTNEQILEDLTAPGEYFSILEFDKLKERVNRIERSLEDLTPKVNTLTRTMEEIFEE